MIRSRLRLIAALAGDQGGDSMVTGVVEEEDEDDDDDDDGQANDDIQQECR